MHLMFMIAGGILLAGLLAEGFALGIRALTILFGKGEDNWYDTNGS